MVVVSPIEIGNLVSLKHLDLTFSSLPDTLSNLSQLVDLDILFCQQLRLLPLLPSNLANIHADRGWCSLDVMSSASIRTKVCKESPFSNRIRIHLPRKKKVPLWCSDQNRGNVLSFVAPVHLDNNICGIFLSVNISDHFSSEIVPKMYNKTKDTSHRFVTKKRCHPIPSGMAEKFVQKRRRSVPEGFVKQETWGGVTVICYFRKINQVGNSQESGEIWVEDEAKFVLEIVVELGKMQRPQELHVTDHPVGIGSRAEELISTLGLDRKDHVLVVAVFGISGIGITKIRMLVRRQKVLLVLDDVENFQQLEALGIDPKWFYNGSRIIVTTRDKRSLGNIPYTSYHTMLLNRRESFNLFTRLLFAREDPMNTKFIEELVCRAGGIPMVTKVWSRHFKHYGREQWPSVLEMLKRIPHGDVQKQLQMSYDSLPNRAKKLFLDIVCFFDGMEKDLIAKVLHDEDSAFFPNNEIQYLIDKSLVEIRPYSRLSMHHAIREMGQEIIRQESEDEPGKRTRLWDERDVMCILTQCLEEQVVVLADAFRKMSNLRCINIDMGNVVVLRLRYSKLEILWEEIKSLKKLRILDVSFSSFLTKTGDFYGLENLEEMCFYGCGNLKELHSSIGFLHKLSILDLRSSIPLKRIPWEMIGKLPSLRDLNLGKIPIPGLDSEELIDPFLSSLKECPITKLKLLGCNISKISREVRSLSWLKHLHIQASTPPLPDNLLQLHELKRIELEQDNMQSIPDLPQNITYIKADECKSLVNLPLNMPELKSLTVLDFRSCPELGSKDPQFLMKVTGLTNLSHLYMRMCGVSQVPNEIGNLVSLKELDLSGNTFTSLPDTLSNLSQLFGLKINDCSQLRSLPLLPSNLTCIEAYRCRSLDVKSSASSIQRTCIFRTKVCKKSPFIKPLVIALSRECIPNWCNYQKRGDFLCFVAPMHLGKNICGVILYATTGTFVAPSTIASKMVNKTKNTSHRLIEMVFQQGAMCVMFYPLDDTTLVVEAGDTVALEFPQKSVSSRGLRLIYDNDVVMRNRSKSWRRRSEIDAVTLAYGGGIVSVSIPIRPELFCIVSVSFSSCCMIVIYAYSISFDLSIEDGCTVVLTTQASTKVKGNCTLDFIVLRNEIISNGDMHLKIGLGVVG
ncbi:hypothetical protein L1987_59520 [Smallanthus sonchifolius]|uniref:Uncharacterized protein n=1 Tax=Smallanthus sonchifolius TaxID=185202 RepID=A0ACB9D5J7_9ASTR|nr:hypothetical protein L1987_59520 [Smallanthus sonchifolius]